MAWCAGFGRLGGVGGPLLGGFLIGAGLALNSIFYVLAGLALLGLSCSPCSCRWRGPREVHDDAVEPTHARPVAAQTPASMRRRRRGRRRPLSLDEEATMYDRILVAIDTSLDENNPEMQRTEQIAKMTGATVHLLHVARGHIVPWDITGGIRPRGGVGRGRRREPGPGRCCSGAVDHLAAAGIEAHGEMVSATEHDVAEVILQRAKELDVDLIVLGLPAPPRARGGSGPASPSR